MRTTIRVIAGIAIIGLLLNVASWAVRDCPVAPYVYENCIWLSVRDQFHFPQSKLLRAVLLEAIGLALLAGLYLDVRFVFPRQRARHSSLPDGRAGRKAESPVRTDSRES